jgi:hypothetical protein
MSPRRCCEMMMMHVTRLCTCSKKRQSDDCDAKCSVVKLQPASGREPGRRHVMEKQEGVSRVKEERHYCGRPDTKYRECGGCGLWWMLMGGDGELQALGARSRSAGRRSTRGVGDSVAEEDAEGEKQASPSLDLRKRGPGFRRTPMTCGGCRGERRGKFSRRDEQTRFGTLLAFFAMLSPFTRAGCGLLGARRETG